LVSEVTRFARNVGRIREDQVKEGNRRNRRKEVRANGVNAFQPVETSVFGSRARGIWIDVDCDHARCPGSRRGKRQNTSARAHVCNALAGEIEILKETVA
jgi:hypothetical protein